MATNNAINLKAQGVAYYDGAGAFSAPTISQYQVVIGAGSNNIASVAPSATSGVPLISQGVSANPVFGTAAVAGGGTGAVSFTAYSVVCAGTTSTGAFQNVSGLGNAGEVLTSAGAGALPVWAAVPISDLPWTVVTGATQAISVDNGYIANRGAGVVAFTLPATAAVGSIVRITGLQSGSGWTLAQNANQYIEMVGSSTTVGTGGSLASTGDNDSIHLVCAVADVGWVCISSMGNITIV